MARILIALALVAGSSFASAAVVPDVACAGTGARAALVVDTGETVHSYCVALSDDEVSGAELIVLAARQHGLSYRFGYGGGAVCMLAGVGTDGDDCFEKYPDFWGYWRGDGSGGWTWSSTGASSTRVSNGDVEGWSWGSGGDGSSHPAPPRTGFSSVCPRAAAEPAPPPAPKERPQPGRASRSDTDAPERDVPAPPAHDAGSDEGQVTSEARTVRDTRPRLTRPERARREDRRNVTARESRPAAPTEPDERPVSVTGPPSGSQDEGPPPAGVAAVFAAGVLGGAGTWLARRRRPRP